jgi:hypothetical protein
VGIRLAPVSLLAGVAAGVGTVAVYQWVWGLLLAAATAVVVVLATPAGWGTRLPFALGFGGVAVLGALPRGEGDYLVSSSASGYAVLGVALLVLCVALATLPRPGPTGARQTEGKAGEE